MDMNGNTTGMATKRKRAIPPGLTKKEEKVLSLSPLFIAPATLMLCPGLRKLPAERTGWTMLSTSAASGSDGAPLLESFPRKLS